MTYCLGSIPQDITVPCEEQVNHCRNEESREKIQRFVEETMEACDELYPEKDKETHLPKSPHVQFMDADKKTQDEVPGQRNPEFPTISVSDIPNNKDKLLSQEKHLTKNNETANQGNLMVNSELFLMMKMIHMMHTTVYGLPFLLIIAFFSRQNNALVPF